MNEDKSELLDALRIDRTERPRRPSPHWAVYAGILLMLAALAVFAWLALQDQAQPVRMAVARSLRENNGPLAGAALLEAAGYVVARRQATVGPKIAGKLRDVLVEEGMHVEAGRVIAHLDDANARVALNQAQASVDQAETAAVNARPLFERSRAQMAQGLISGEAYDTAKASFDQARTAAALARAALAVAPPEPGRHGGARAIRRRGDRQSGPGWGDRLADVRGRRLHAHGDSHPRRHGFAGSGDRRQRELHQPRQPPTSLR